MIPSAQNNQPFQYGVPNVTLFGTSLLTGEQATAAVDYNLKPTDRLSVKYYYQTDPVAKPYGVSATGGFPIIQANGSQVAAIGNTISIGPRVNWEQRLGYVRMGSYSRLHPDCDQFGRRSELWRWIGGRRIYPRAGAAGNC